MGDSRGIAAGGVPVLQTMTQWPEVQQLPTTGVQVNVMKGPVQNTTKHATGGPMIKTMGEPMVGPMGSIVACPINSQLSNGRPMEIQMGPEQMIRRMGGPMSRSTHSQMVDSQMADPGSSQMTHTTRSNNVNGVFGQIQIRKSITGQTSPMKYFIKHAAGGPTAMSMEDSMFCQMGSCRCSPMAGGMRDPMGTQVWTEQAINRMSGPSCRCTHSQMSNPILPQMADPISSQMTHMMHHRSNGSEEIILGAQNDNFIEPHSTNHYLWHRPTPPPVPSPADLVCSNQMEPPPAHVPTHSVQMALTPSNSHSTSGQTVSMPNQCCSAQEEQAYRDTLHQLSEYIEPLCRAADKIKNEDVIDVEKLGYVKEILEILTKQGKRLSLEALHRLEIILVKIQMTFGESTGQTSFSALWQELRPLFEALDSHVQKIVTVAIHYLIGPYLNAQFNSDIKLLPPPLKKKKLEETVDSISEVVNGKITSGQNLKENEQMHEELRSLISEKTDSAQKKHDFDKKKRYTRLVEDLLQEVSKTKSTNAVLRAKLSAISDRIESEMLCSICFEIIINVTVLNCGHIFCQVCIHEWLEKKSEARENCLCPICKTSVKFVAKCPAVMSLLQSVSEELPSLKRRMPDK